MIREFVPLWILAPLAGIMAGLANRGINSSFLWTAFSNTKENVMVGTMMLIFLAVMVALTAMTVLFIIQRFWNGLLKEEGYLMFTLPVEAWELITAKGLAATLIACVSILVGVISCGFAVLFSASEVIEALSSVWRTIYNGFFRDTYSPFYWFVAMLFWLLLGIFSVAKSIYGIYAAMALGHLFPKHRVAGACISYVGMTAALSFISGIGTSIRYSDFGRTVVADLTDFLGSNYSLAYYLGLLLITILQLVLFHIITERVLATRLNLE